MWGKATYFSRLGQRHLCLTFGAKPPLSHAFLSFNSNRRRLCPALGGYYPSSSGRMGIGIYVYHMICFFRNALVSQLVFWRLVALPDAPLALQHLPVLHPEALPLSTSQQCRCPSHAISAKRMLQLMRGVARVAVLCSVAPEPSAKNLATGTSSSRCPRSRGRNFTRKTTV